MAKQRRYDFVDEGFLGRLERLRLIAKHLAGRGPSGQRRSRRLGDGLEFADHRSYAEGDDIRFIDWRYYARMEKLLVRLFHEHSEAGVAILLDVSASMAPGGNTEKFDHARRTAAALAFVAMGSLERVTLLAFADGLDRSMQTGRNRGRIFEVLDFLADLRPGGRTELRLCVERFGRRPGSPGTVILLSDLLDCAGELSDALARLTSASWTASQPRGRDVTVLHLYCPDDASPQLAGPILLEHCETDDRLGLNVTREVLAGYSLRWEKFLAACKRTCLSRGVLYAAAPSNVPPDRLLLSTLRRAGIVGR